MICADLIPRLGTRARHDGKRAADGVSFMVLGVDHPYEAKSDDTPSLLPEGAIAVRFHSVGGWGAITTGKNLGAIIGDLNDLLYERDKIVDELGNPKEIIHVSANPKYGSEKKGAPTAYFMIAAPERIRVNCDLRHVNVVLCCDPKAFTHTNPLDGMSEGGCLVWESDEEGEQAWERLPLWARQQIIDKNIRVFTLPGFRIAREATDRGDLQLRMQGNAFLGAFFAVSPMLQDFRITQEQFRDAVHKQYVKKFGRLGDSVVQSNMEVMTKGFDLVREIRVGELEAPSQGLAHLVPVDHVPPRGDVVRPAVLILQVVGVLPYVEPENRRLPLHQRIVLIRRAGDGELPAIGDQPRPAAAEAASRRLGELLFEGIEAAKGSVDRVGNLAGGRAAGVRRHPRPESAVIPLAAAVVTNGRTDGLRHLVDLAAQLFNGLGPEVRLLFQRRVQVIDVRLMMFSVMNLHGLRVDVRLERGEIVGKLGQFVRHESPQRVTVHRTFQPTCVGQKAKVKGQTYRSS